MVASPLSQPKWRIFCLLQAVHGKRRSTAACRHFSHSLSVKPHTQNHTFHTCCLAYLQNKLGQWGQNRSIRTNTGQDTCVRAKGLDNMRHTHTHRHTHTQNLSRGLVISRMLMTCSDCCFFLPCCCYKPSNHHLPTVIVPSVRQWCLCEKPVKFNFSNCLSKAVWL